MAEHRFGGKWTDQKLDCLRQYLTAYRNIFDKNPQARYFKTWFVDAFAGTGSRSAATPLKTLALFDDVYDDSDAGQYREGSARIALGLGNPFDHYLFIERAIKRLTALRSEVEAKYSGVAPRCTYRHGDANSVLRTWCRERDWKKERAVVFLDPYGMQVEWATIDVIAGTKAIDLWYLFPLGMGVARMLESVGNIDPAWQRNLDSVLGTPSWRDEFYKPSLQGSLFGGDENKIERSAGFQQIEEFIHRRLRAIFPGVVQGAILYNSKNYPMYLLCFAAGNKAGAPIAVRIAQSILTG